MKISRRTTWGYAIALVGTAGLVAIFLGIREDVDPLSKGFGFLALVVVTVSVGGLGPGIAASILGFACFNYFFLPPYDTFVINKAEDVVVLFVFLGLSVLISVLIARSDARARSAEGRAAELRLQQDLSRALVEPQPDADRYGGVLRLVVSTFGFEDGALFEQPGADLAGLEEMSVVNSPAGSIPVTAGEGVERFPLNVGRRNLGLLVLRGPRPPLTQSERNILEAFGNQLALLLERDRLLRAAIPAPTPGAAS
jgi:two-component system, OmpR family, sensor histidine kinase KdpD